MWLAKERPKKTIDSTDRLRQLQQQQPNKTNEQRILKSALMQSANSTPFSNGSVNNSSIDVVSVRRNLFRRSFFLAFGFDSVGLVC